ncbi:MAG: hypothetical protein IPK67_08390 [Planctomycetes bacterium]|nr:hypothetical protein [Planctomycetota bacterium]
MATLPPQPPATSPVTPRRPGRFLDWAILVGVVAVVVIVSLPRLSAFAKHENESDARQLLRRLALPFGDDSLEAAPPRDTLDLFERLPRVARRQFEDQIVLEDGRLILRHGYYFEFLRLPGFAGDSRGVMAVRAWPERCTDAASPAYVALSNAGLLRHRRLEPPACGLERPPEFLTPHLADLQARGWELVTDPGGD